MTPIPGNPCTKGNVVVRDEPGKPVEVVQP